MAYFGFSTLLLGIIFAQGAYGFRTHDVQMFFPGVGQSYANPPADSTACLMGYFMELGYATAQGSCDALSAAKGGSGGPDICGGPGAASGDSGHRQAQYSMASHQPVQRSPSSPVEFPNNGTDCSGQVCAAWMAAGFKLKSKDLRTGCPTAADFAKLQDDCLEDVSDEKYQVGDAVCCPREGGGAGGNGATGHCVNICGQASKGGQGVEPTSKVQELTVCNASGKDSGWNLENGSLAFGSSVMNVRGCRILRPKPKENSDCWGQPPGFKGQESVRSCQYLPQVSNVP